MGFLLNPFIMGSSFVRYGKAYFDGNGDYLSLNSYITDFNFLHQVGTAGKWTFETKFAAKSFASYNIILDTTRATSNNHGAVIYVSPTRVFSVQITRGVTSSFVLLYNSAAGVYPNDFNEHDIEINYDHSLASNNLKVFIDGSLVAQANKTSNAPSTSNCGVPYIGTEGTSWANCYLRGLRITNGICRNTTTFTPPLYYTVDDAGVALCMNFAEAIGSTTFIDETGKTVTTNGNTIIVA